MYSDIIQGLRHIAKMIKFGWSKELVRFIAAVKLITERTLENISPRRDPARFHILSKVIETLQPHSQFTHAHDIYACLGKDAPHAKAFDLDRFSSEALAFAEEIEGFEPTADGDTEKQKAHKKKKISEETVLACLFKHPDWSNKQIAEETGCHIKSIPNMQLVKVCREVQKRDGASRIPRGGKNSKTRKLERRHHEHRTADVNASKPLREK